MMFKEYPDILTPKQAAVALGVCVNSIYQLVNTHTIGCKRIGRKILIPKICLINYVRSSMYTVKV